MNVIVPAAVKVDVFDERGAAGRFSRSSPARPEIRSLTSIRGIAAWLVVLYHCNAELLPFLTPPLSGVVRHGYAGVDLFFQLSGFVIAMNYGGMLRRSGLSGYLRFLGIRLARIYPLHIVMLLAFLSLPAAMIATGRPLSTPGQFDPGYFLASIFLVQNWGFTGPLAWNFPAWSISTEWFCYLACPVLLWAVTRAATNPARAGLCIAGLLGVTALLSAAAGGLGKGIVTFGLSRCVAEFAAGACVFRLTTLVPPLTGRLADAASLGAALLVALYAALPLPDYAALPPAFALLILSLSADGGVLGRALSARNRAARLLHVLGVVSYSTYLVHILVRDWVRLLVERPGMPPAVPILLDLALVAALSFLMYRSVELPGRQALRRLIARVPASGRDLVRSSPPSRSAG